MKFSFPAILLIFLAATPIAAKGSGSSGGGRGSGSSSSSKKSSNAISGSGEDDEPLDTFEEYTKSADYDFYHNGGAHFATRSLGEQSGTYYTPEAAEALFPGTWADANVGWNISYSLALNETAKGTVICLCQLSEACGCGPEGWEEVAGFDGGGNKTMREIGTNTFVVNGTADAADLKEEDMQREKWEADKDNAGSRQGSPTGKMAGGAMMLALLVGAAL